MKFFLTGLPRCRSAWWSNLLTWGESFCWHEGAIIPGMTPIEMRNVTLKSPLNNVGVSDPSLVFHWKRVADTFPNAKWVSVIRNVSESVNSVREIEPHLAYDALDDAKVELDSLTVHTSAFRVCFDHINPQTCYSVADYLGVCIGPIERVRQLCDMNVQIHPPILKARLETLKRQPLVDTYKAA